jgi:hypothetical protein
MSSWSAAGRTPRPPPRTRSSTSSPSTGASAEKGEHAFVELLDALLSGADPCTIPGVVGRAGGRIVAGPPRGNIEDLDALPRPARHLLPMREYRTRMHLDHAALHDTADLARLPGALHLLHARLVSRARRASTRAAYMADEIESIIADWGLRAFIMQDDTFTLNKSRIRAFCDAGAAAPVEDRLVGHDARGLRRPRPAALDARRPAAAW